jgi:sarcosine/dimethylglycine N-methyltransferase
VQWAREPSTSFLLTQQATREKLETAGFRVLVWQDTTAEAWQAVQARARHVEGPPPVPGTHLIIGDDWRAMFRNPARNLEERRT